MKILKVEDIKEGYYLTFISNDNQRVIFKILEIKNSNIKFEKIKYYGEYIYPKNSNFNFEKNTNYIIDIFNDVNNFDDEVYSSLEEIVNLYAEDFI